ncbi:Eco57I restriction-modification methylase domain-containing protein [Chloroflexota bacterium]
MEAGYLPQDKHFGKADEQADKRLINDLKEVRKQLREINDLKLEFAHALIGRSIFIRYLEDRKVLHPAYFEQVAAKHQRDDWLKLLNEQPPLRLIQDEKWQDRRYYQVLQDKDFTYVLFEQLAEDFNGDLFPKNETEKKAVTVDHLRELRRFLLGDPDPKQRTLWLWAYDFEIVPIELISSIYEEFYKNEQDDPGTHYTPSVLVEFVLSQVLPQSYLAANPIVQILDPACGSGIFLVEAYRRLVRYRIWKEGRPLDSVELREILRDQIRGIELNKNATYVAAFSLYLALLHYQDPSDILAQIEFPQPDDKPLPHLIYKADQVGQPNRYEVLFNCNAFDLTKVERTQLLAEFEANPRRITLKRFLDAAGDLPIEANSVDVIVGNPPWGFVRKNKATPEIAEAQEKAKEWCQRLDWSIGDNEQSQAFIARSFGLLTKNGVCGLLVSTGVFWKGQDKSQKFRQRWFHQCTIKTVTNFAHVRHIFFEQAISPFAVVHYVFQKVSLDHYIQYWSAKRTEIIEDKPRVILHLSDLKRVRQAELQNNEWLWKIYWWGSHRDANLINILNLDQTLEKVSLKNSWESGGGYTPGSVISSSRRVFYLGEKFFSRLNKEIVPTEIVGKLRALKHQEFKKEKDLLKNLRQIIGKDATNLYKQVIFKCAEDRLSNYKELPIGRFERYGTVNDTDLIKVPEKVHRDGIFKLYKGWRLLVAQGIKVENVNGQILARLDELTFCFRNSVYAIKLDDAEPWQRQILLGILWSSFARYYLFMTTSFFGIWRDKILLDELKRLPVRFPNDPELRETIVQIVSELQTRSNAKTPLFTTDFHTDKIEAIDTLLNRLDDAIFTLYELNDAERDLVLDLCKTGLEFCYRHSNSDAGDPLEPYPQAKQGFITDLPRQRDTEKGLEGYLYAFLDMWQSYLEPDGVFRWQVVRPDNDPMVAVVFTTQSKYDDLPSLQDDEAMWAELKRIVESSRWQINPRIYIDGLVCLVTDDNDKIIIIKRNERRLWTRSQAREDAEATFLQAMRLQENEPEIE